MPGPGTVIRETQEDLAAKNGHLSQEGTEPDYLTPEQVKAMLQVSVKSILRWAKQDPSMPMLKIGGTVRFPRTRLLVWLRAREQGAGRPRQTARLMRSQTQGHENVNGAER